MRCKVKQRPHLFPAEINGLTLNHVVELSSLSNTFIRHNRFYVPSNAQSLDFDLNIVQKNVQQSGQLEIVATIEGAAQPTVISSIALNGTTNSYQHLSVLLPVELRGKAITLEFSLAALPLGSGADRVRLDNIALTLSQPLQTASTQIVGAVSQTLDSNTLTQVLATAQGQWTGLVNVPIGSTDFGLTLGSTTSANISQGETTPGTPAKTNRSAGFSQHGLDNQCTFANSDFIHELTFGSEQKAALINTSTDQFWADRDAAFTTDSHTIESQLDSVLAVTQHEAVGQVRGEQALETNIGNEGALVNSGSIVGIPNLNLSVQSTSPGGNSSISDLEVFDLQKLSLFSLQPGTNLFQVPELQGIQVLPIVNVTAPLAQSKDEQDQNALPHSLSFGSLTLPPDRNLVNSSGAFGAVGLSGLFGLSSAGVSFDPNHLPLTTDHSPLSADQLALLNQATITIADLAEGYLALTTGSTITLDTDAAGYGWFIDSTPLLNEEFSADAASPWQFTALDGSAAAGKIDLMTVLMHELGHVMGLGHVSSAVDGTRLMAGSIDPGIRRLPSSLDVGLSGLSGAGASSDPDNSTLEDVWAPYLVHYTQASDATPTTPLTPSNPARLVQAAQIPSHAGIFNSNFANSDPQSANFGWDESGAVTIANGQAVLSEDSNVISTLSQLFTLPANSTHLRFTLVDANLQTNGVNRPSDAFEVAFLESSTLTPLAGVTAGLTQTDSLFNLQQDGTVRFSNRVSLSNGTLSGSTLDLTQPVMVDIDLTGIAVGAGARLSFDLLGFGDRTSSIVLDNVLLTNGQATAAPVAAGDSYTVAEGATLTVPTLGLLTNDLDSDTSAFSLTALLQTAPTHGTLTLNADGSFTYVHNGSEAVTDSFTYRVSDGINVSNLATVSLTITPVNDAPVIAAIAPQTVEQGRTLSVTVNATDPDVPAQTLTYSLNAGAPAGATIHSATGVVTWAVPAAQTLGLYSLTVRATDNGTPVLFSERTFTVEVLQATNVAPVLAPIGAKAVNEETELRFTISATDADLPAQTLTYSATGLPTGATFDAISREFAWTPTEAQGPGSYVVTFSVTDGVATTSEAVTISVAEVNLAPVLAPITDKTVNEGTLLTFSASATDADVPAQSLTYSLAAGAPTGAVIDGTTGVFTWTPTEAQGPNVYTLSINIGGVIA